MSFTIPAEVHDDDFQFEVAFDALPWFEQADDESIKALMACDWGGDYPADDVAMFFDGRIQAVTDLFKYKRLGFECHVESGPAMEWLEQHRPHLVVD